jgi:hypothetical protein
VWKRCAVGYISVALTAIAGWSQELPAKPQDAPQPVAPEAASSRNGPGTIPANNPSWRLSPFENQPYTPLSLKEKTYVFMWRNIQPSSFGKSAFTAAIAQWQDQPTEWGQGMEGYGKRYGHRILNRAVETTMGLGVAAALHQDPRYFRLGEGGFRRRTGHALSYVLLTRTDSGGKTFSVWRVSSNYGAQFVSNSWRPVNTTAAAAMARGTISLGFDAASNVFKEFWPDLRRLVFRK